MLSYSILFRTFIENIAFIFVIVTKSVIMKVVITLIIFYLKNPYSLMELCSSSVENNGCRTLKKDFFKF